MSIVFLVLAIAFMIASPLCKGKDWLVALCLIVSMICLLLTIIYPIITD